MSVYIAISIIALIIIVGLLLFVRERGRKYSKPSNLAILGMALVVLGIIFSDERWLGYSFIGVGVVLSLIDAVRSRNK
jgi:hypothetical protein